MTHGLADHLCYEFDGFRLDVTRRVVETCRDGRTVPLEPRVFAAALYLVQHAGCVLSKERLLAELWPDSVVEENSLAQVISVLRRSLGESRDDHRYIVTVPRRGYCFVADVKPADEMVGARSAGSCGVVVATFDVWSTLRDDVQLALGIAESTGHSLARTSGVCVISEAARADRSWRPTAAAPGRSELRFRVEGRLQRAGPCLRITARLVDTADGAYLWSMLMDCTTENVLLVEDEVSQRVAGALRQVLTLEPRSRARRMNGAAYPATERGQSSATG